ncbi:copper homeostasis protein CutC [Luteolibacter pohnpeiensis]|uniref:PF03932 family protein CutC n=1 Tax=Luteolibacter pohnpeiensis TaxID=454153 RepID=A0A934SBV1_9BACT|nr:copper homeostasis protein CutC [Luteolibacter pohnpeiensis]MBK1882438.1 copper homeostasis protein CutC [Luteolibacter pohnpeiensis]
MILEICIDSVESAIAADRAGAKRVELCAGLFEGGLTPSAGMIKAVRSRVTLGVMVIIRARGGDFLFNDEEMEAMLEDISVAKKLGADGVVIGCLNANGTIDEDKTKALIAEAGPLPVTFHRAFDMCRDPFEALDQLASLGIKRILTSGQESSVLEGADLIRDLVKAAGDRIIILPGGGITSRNIHKIAALTEAPEFHLSCRRPVESGMEFRNLRPSMGAALFPPEFSRRVADESKIRTIIQNG